MIVLIFAFGCADKSEDPAGLGDSGSVRMDELTCEQMNEAQCSSSACVTVYGWQLEQEGDLYCLDESVYMEERTYAGCATNQSSLTVEVTAGPADWSACWLFSSGAMPDGWLECEELGFALGVCEE